MLSPYCVPNVPAADSENGLPRWWTELPAVAAPVLAGTALGTLLGRHRERKASMSWSYNKTGRASNLGEVVNDQMVAQGGPKGCAEEAAKNSLGEIAEVLCKSLTGDPVVRVDAEGSAWNNSDGPRSHSVSFKFETLGDFVG
jgi:hypothetical protein